MKGILVAALFLAVSPSPNATAALSSWIQPVTSPSPLATDRPFLSLPAYDLERISAPVPAGSPTPDAAKAFVGDRVELQVQGMKASGGKVELPKGAEELFEDTWTLDVGAEEKTPGVRFSARPLKPGSLTLPSLLVSDSAGKAIGRTNPFSLEVVSVVSNPEEKPVDIRPPLEVGFPWWVVFAAILGVLILFGIIFFIVRRYFWDVKVKKEPEPPNEPALPEDEWALRELDLLYRAELLQKGDFKRHYFRLSEIMKTFLGSRFGFDALESTTRELIEMMRRREVLGARNETALENVQAFFEKLDLVKFTDYVPPAEQGSSLLNEALQFVKTNRRPPEPTENADGGKKS
jgi:hypothetical protein